MSEILRVKEAFSPERVKKRLLADISDFKAIGDVADTVDGIYVYRNNKQSVLGVAHLDSVRTNKHFIRTPFKGDTVYFASQCDDRLGAYIILDLLPKLGIQYDILLTEGEESGRSTARYFEPPDGKKYNWIFSFDREGTDVVMYEYEESEHYRMLADLDLTLGFGSFSDICYLEDLKAKGFNFGTGYYESHGLRAHFRLSHMAKQVARFLKFYQKYKSTSMKHKPSGYKRRGHYSATWYCGYGTYADDYVDYQRDGTASYSPEDYVDFECACGNSTIYSFLRGTIRTCYKCQAKYYRDWREKDENGVGIEHGITLKESGEQSDTKFYCETCKASLYHCFGDEYRCANCWIYYTVTDWDNLTIVKKDKYKPVPTKEERDEDEHKTYHYLSCDVCESWVQGHTLLQISLADINTSYAACETCVEDEQALSEHESKIFANSESETQPLLLPEESKSDPDEQETCLLCDISYYKSDLTDVITDTVPEGMMVCPDCKEEFLILCDGCDTWYWIGEYEGDVCYKCKKDLGDYLEKKHAPTKQKKSWKSEWQKKKNKKKKKQEEKKEETLKATHCHFCQNEYAIKEQTWSYGGTSFCETCLRLYFRQCAVCKGFFEEGHINEHNVCTNCLGAVVDDGK